MDPTTEVDPFSMVLGAGEPVKRYESFSHARHDARKLATDNPGKQFCVLKSELSVVSKDGKLKMDNIRPRNDWKLGKNTYLDIRIKIQKDKSGFIVLNGKSVATVNSDCGAHAVNPNKSLVQPDSLSDALTKSLCMEMIGMLTVSELLEHIDPFESIESETDLKVLSENIG